jgi:hypothetical protein
MHPTDWAGSKSAPYQPVLNSRTMASISVQVTCRGALGASSNRVAKKNARYPGLPGLARKTWPGYCNSAGPPPEGAGAHYASYSTNRQFSSYLEPARIGPMPVTPGRWVNFGSMVSDRAAHDVPVVCRSDVHRNKETHEQVRRRLSYRLTGPLTPSPFTGQVDRHVIRLRSLDKAH